MKSKKSKSFTKTILIHVLRVLGICFVLVALLFTFLTVTEYRPKDVETVSVERNGKSIQLAEGTDLKVLTWNIGYGALGDNADFFMDGGKNVYTADENRVQENLTQIAQTISEAQADVVFLQEVDVSSDRSYKINEVDALQSKITESYMNESFANNFNVAYVPYPIPPIGKVNSGIVTLTSYNVAEATRYALPCPFTWPVRIANLKRCLLVNRIPLVDETGRSTGHSLVLVNLHLEAYDDGEGKKEQTRIMNEIIQTEMDQGNYVIAGGDFNQTFSSVDGSKYPSYEGMWQSGEIEESEFSDDWQFLMDESVPTCRSLDQAYAGADKENFQYYVIDGFIVSKNIDVRSVATVDKGFQSTDHNPVVMEIHLQ